MTGRKVGTVRKMAAVLAGGLVLGIGAATTMAAWTDSQEVTATFKAGIFKLESKTTEMEEDWKHWDSSLEIPLMMNASGMSPGASSFGFVDVRTTGDSTLGGETQLKYETEGVDINDIMVNALQFRAKSVSANTICSAGIFDTEPFLEATAESAPGTPAPQELLAGADDAPGSAVRYCVEVRMKTSGVSNDVQGMSANLIWTVHGSSI